MFRLQDDRQQVSRCRIYARVVLRRAFRRTGEYKWELVKRKDWQLSSTTWDDQRARLFLIHAKLEASRPAFTATTSFGDSIEDSAHGRYGTRFPINHPIRGNESLGCWTAQSHQKIERRRAYFLALGFIGS
jgi:hypothetical protein